MAATEWERSETEPGSIILGRYRLLSPLASGAMGSVWRAQDLTLLRTVALKLLFVREDAAGRTMGERFLREARIAAGIRHRNVVDVLDFGTSEQGRPFMVMELLEGESLESRCERLPALTLHELITIVAGVLDGLTAVHKVGVVHRDLKPANILLVASEDSDPRPKLVDFGVAHAPERRSALTSVTGIVVGTPEYMSPEQARGVPVDARSDLYSVGAILYEALAGRLPYEQEALGDLIIAIASGGAPPVAEVRPEVGEAISAVVSRAMELRPEDRFQSAREMRDALLRALWKR
ncbi:MAG: serine/threonine protein kinase, partial [Sandaracinaceae bacterium]|nr:serine/threonine protein kinase [Sandaracinaceae bacterium]